MNRPFIAPHRLAQIYKGGRYYDPEGEYVWRMLKEFDRRNPVEPWAMPRSEAPERLPWYVCLRVIGATSVALWLAIFAIGYFVAQLLRAVFS